jgi:acetylornithine deacetylase
VIERLARYVSIPSLSREEGALADQVAADLAAAGLSVQRRANNVWCELGGRPRPRLLLNSHLDTVPPGQGWSTDPWTPRRDGDRLVGLGANDAKGCVTAMIEMLLAGRAASPVSGTVVLALTAEEEIGGEGLSTIVEELKPLDGAIVGEPTSLVPMIAQRGLLSLRCVARGRTAHPANTTPALAQNAIVAAARDLLALQDFDWGPEHPLLGRCHGHVTMIHGGVALNVIPDACEFHLDVRTTPIESHAALRARLSSALASELHVRSDRCLPVETPADAAIVRAVLQACPGARPSGSPAMSDMVHLRGVPCVKFGPGDTRRSHTPGEYITVSELETGARAYARVVDAFFRLAQPA